MFKAYRENLQPCLMRLTFSSLLENMSLKLFLGPPLQNIVSCGAWYWPLLSSWPVGLLSESSCLVFKCKRLVWIVFVFLPPCFLLFDIIEGHCDTLVLCVHMMCVFEILMCLQFDWYGVEKQDVLVHHSTLPNLASSMQSSWLSCLMGYLHQLQTVVIKLNLFFSCYATWRLNSI